MNPKERVISQIKHRETDFVPYHLYFDEEFDIEALNSYFEDNSWQTKFDKHIIELNTSAPREDCGDSTTTGEKTDAYGIKRRVDKRPMHIIKPALDRPTLAGYRFPDADSLLSKGWEERALQLANEKKDHFLLFSGFSFYDRVWMMRGEENFFMDLFDSPDFCKELIEQMFECQMGMLERVLASSVPIDGVMFGDDWGYQEGIIIGAERWRKIFKPYVAKIYARIHEAGKYTINHMCGSVAEILPDLIEIGLDVYQGIQPEAKNNSPYRLKRLYGKDITFWGGLGTQNTIPFGIPSEIKLEVRKLCREMGKGGGYIIDCSKSILPDVPTENAAAVIEAFLEQAGVNI